VGGGRGGRGRSLFILGDNWLPEQGGHKQREKESVYHGESGDNFRAPQMTGKRKNGRVSLSLMREKSKYKPLYRFSRKGGWQEGGAKIETL